MAYTEKEGKQLGLRLNVVKSELICNDSTHAQGMHMLSTLQYVNPDQAVLLGSPLGTTSL